MKIKDKNFSKEEIHMDFKNFEGCKFEDCSLIYHGYGPIGMNGCSFFNVRWSFADAAANTLSFMSALYVGAGQGGKDLIDQTINNIKSGKPLPSLKKE